MITHGGEARGNIVKADLGANVKNLSDSFTSFLQAFGAPLVPVAISALQSVSGPQIKYDRRSYPSLRV
ncbi:MAG: hypothetical protein WDN46_11290 [Methylocella sp.]